MGKRVAVAAAVVAVLALVVWASLSGSTGKGAGVDVEKVGKRLVVARVKASGTINPLRKVEVQSKVIGEIVSLPVKEGDHVRNGQIVLEIEKQLYLAARDQAKAAFDQATVSLEQTRVELATAETNFRRIEGLHREGVSSDDALDQARLRRDTAAIAVRVQEEAIHQSRSAYQRTLDDLDRTTLRAPMDGVVTKLNVEKGETAVMGTMNFAGSVLMTIGDLSELVAEVDVAESEVVALALGQSTRVLVDALPDTPLAGHVFEIGSSGVKQGDVVKFKVKIALDRPDARVRPGMTAKVEITTARAENVLAVPQQVVQTRWLDAKGKEVTRREGDSSQREVTAVYLLDNAKAARREVKTGIHDELWVEVKGGLSDGAEVVSGPYRVLRDLKDGDALHRNKERPSGERAKETPGAH
jgi:HlyD family secretion protein